MPLIFRLLGGLLWVCCGWYGGRLRACAAAAHRRTLEECVQFTAQLSQEITFRKVSLDWLLRELKYRHDYPLLALDTAERMQDTVPPACLTAKERQLFTDCFSGLGRGTAAQEAQRLAYYGRQFELCAAQARTEEQQGMRLYPRLGTCLGAMLAELCM